MGPLEAGWISVGPLEAGWTSVCGQITSVLSTDIVQSCS